MSEEKKIIQSIKKVIPSVVSILGSISPAGDIFSLFRKGGSEIVSGSGFFLDKNGLIVTDSHVIKEDKDCFILDWQQRKFRAKIISVNQNNDTAFLKVEAKKTRPVKLGDSDSLQVGQTVLSIGTSLGIFQSSVSKGIVSGISRTIVAFDSEKKEKEFYGLIQTDAAINPGNSGGPLVNLKGEVIGINTATVFGAENLGFALPINAIKDDLEEIKLYGRIRPLNLGLYYILLDKSISKFLDLPLEKGALLIKEPPENSPAYLGGLRKGDIILEIEGLKIRPKETIRKIIRRINKKVISFKVYRSGKIIEKKLPL